MKGCKKHEKSFYYLGEVERLEKPYVMNEKLSLQAKRLQKACVHDQNIFKFDRRIPDNKSDRRVLVKGPKKI